MGVALNTHTHTHTHTHSWEVANDRDLWLESEEIGVKARHSSFVFIDQSSLPFRMARPLDCRTEKSVNRIDHVPQYYVAGVVASSAPKLSPL